MQLLSGHFTGVLCLGSFLCFLAAPLFAVDKASFGGYAATKGNRAVIGLSSDMATTARVRTKLSRDERVKASRIDVRTCAGVVTLTGKVRETEEKLCAISITTNVKGVSRVIPNILVSLIHTHES